MVCLSPEGGCIPACTWAEVGCVSQHAIGGVDNSVDRERCEQGCISPEAATEAGGTHPTAMLSCRTDGHSFSYLSVLCNIVRRSCLPDGVHAPTFLKVQ